MNFDIGNIRSDDLVMQARAHAYLLENPDPGIRFRPDYEFKKAMDTGLPIVVLNNGNICGLSLVYKFTIPPDGPVYSEIGTMRITANGYDLQAFLAKFHLLQMQVEEDEAENNAVFAVVTPKTASAHILQNKVGMSAWNPNRELEVVRGDTGVPFSKEKQALNAPPSAFSAARSDLRNWHQKNNIFKTPKGDGLVRVTFGWFTVETLKGR